MSQTTIQTTDTVASRTANLPEQRQVSSSADLRRRELTDSTAQLDAVSLPTQRTVSRAEATTATETTQVAPIAARVRLRSLFARVTGAAITAEEVQREAERAAWARRRRTSDATELSHAGLAHVTMLRGTR